MYVYVTKFEGKPNLLKIGKSISPVTRNEILSKSHGGIIYSGHYKIGSGYTAVESYLHNKYSDYREKVSGDGGTEFFSDSIYDDVSTYLNKYKDRDCQYLDEEFIRAQLKIERKRYYNLVGRLLGYKYCDSHTGEYHSSYIGMFDIVKIDACYEMGFSPQDICSNYILNVKSSAGFTTPGRVALAYKLATQGTTKSKNLESLLITAVENNKVLLH